MVGHSILLFSSVSLNHKFKFQQIQASCYVHAYTVEFTHLSAHENVTSIEKPRLRLCLQSYVSNIVKIIQTKLLPNISCESIK